MNRDILKTIDETWRERAQSGTSNNRTIDLNHKKIKTYENLEKKI